MKNKLWILPLVTFCSLFTSKTAKAVTITIPLNYTVEETDNQNLSISGNMVIDTNASGAANRHQINGQRPNPVAVPAWVTSITLNLVDSGDAGNNATLNKSDFVGFTWQPKAANVGSVDFDSDLVAQFDDISFYSIGKAFTSSAAMNLDTGEDEFVLTSTPAPLVFMGILPFLNYSRKLKKVIKNSQCYRIDQY